MKLIALLAIATLGQVHAAEEFGGFNFHSTVAKSQSEALKSDIKYLYQNPITKPDAEFISTGEMSAGDGLNMHNWLINRVRYIIGQSYQLNDANVIGTRFNFPKTSLPILPDAPTSGGGSGTPGGETPAPNPEVKVIMTNLGGALYIAGKPQGFALGIKFDGKNLYAKSPRVGLLQVGEGLFLERFMLNKDIKAPANAIFRLGTLFHEARHSDGNGAHSGFLHDYCPTGHPYAGYGACEASGNGSYTIGALSTRHLLQNCAGCSTAEKSALQANVLDSFSRIISNTNSSRISTLQSLVETYKSIKTIYEANASSEQAKIEIKTIENQIVLLELEIASLSVDAQKAPFLDARPEGEYDKFSLDDSRRLMTKALK